MVRLLLLLIALLLISLLSLAAVWLLGELFAGLGGLLIALSRLLARLLRFVLVGGVLSGAAYILLSAWRRPSAERLRQ